MNFKNVGIKNNSNIFYTKNIFKINFLLIFFIALTLEVKREQ